MGGQERNLGLDVARAAAIVAVVGSHCATSVWSWPGWARNTLDMVGQAGVELFFSLSGFLIGGILIRLAEGGLGWRAIGGFMARRWFRTLPLYFLTLIAVGTWLGMDIGRSALLLQNFFPTEPRPLPVSWSLVMEEYFYFVFPLAMVGIGLAGIPGRWNVVVVAGVLIVGCSAVRLWNVAPGGPGWGAMVVHESPLLRLDCAAYGAVAAWLARYRPALVAGLVGRGAAGLALVCTFVVAGAVFGLVWVLGASIEALVAWGFLAWGKAFMAMQPSLLDLGFAGIVLLLARRRLTLPRWAAWTVRWVSVLSYSLYLVHLPVFGEVARSGAQWAPGMIAGIEVIGSLAVASATYWCIERPFLWLRDQLVPEARIVAIEMPAR